MAVDALGKRISSRFMQYSAQKCVFQSTAKGKTTHAFIEHIIPIRPGIQMNSPVVDTHARFPCSPGSFVTGQSPYWVYFPDGGDESIENGGDWVRD